MCSLDSKASQAASRTGDIDAELVQRALADPAAFAGLYERYADQLYRYVLQRVEGPETADDLVSETMIAALERLDRYDPERGTFTAWLFTIAWRRVADHHRLHSRFWRAITQRWKGPPQPRDETTDQVIQRYEYQAVRSAIATLPDSEQELLALRYGANLNSVEIAEILGMSDGNVRVRLQRTREKLATELGDLL